MNTLRDNHKRFIYTTFAVTASFYFFLVLKEPMTKGTLDFLGWFGVSWSLIASLVVFLYEKWIWRACNRKFDFVGTWRFTEKQYRQGAAQPECYAAGSMRIVQNVRSISITEGQTYEVEEEDLAKEGIHANLAGARKTSDWWSIACELDDNASRIYSTLDHQSALNRKGKPLAYGVEVFRVTKRTRWGRPIKMSSTVYHCIGAGKPRQIDVSYIRDGF